MWTYPTIDCVTGEVVADHVPFRGVSFSRSLTSGGSFSGTLQNGFQLLSADMRNHASRFITFPSRDGKPFGAYLWTTGPAVSLDEPEQQVQAVGAEQIFKQRPIMDDLVFTDVEQLDIARDLLRYGMGQPTRHTNPIVTPDASWRAWAALPWLRIHAGTTGRTRSRTQVVNGQDDDGYRRKGHKDVYTAVDQLANVLDGFGYRFDPYIDDDGLFVLVQWGDPILGGLPEFADRCVFEWPGGNIIEGSYGWDGADYANRVEIVGGETEGVTAIGYAQNTADLVAGYPLRVATLSLSSVTDQGTLDEKAAAELALRSVIKDGYTVKLDGAKPPVLGTYELGDHVTLRIERRGAALDERVMRITALAIDVDDSGLSEVVTPTLGERAW